MQFVYDILSINTGQFIQGCQLSHIERESPTWTLFLPQIKLPF